MDTTSEEEPRHYRQATTAAAMSHELDEARARIRQLDNLVGVLNREADYQAATIAELREDVKRWRSLYMRASAAAEEGK